MIPPRAKPFILVGATAFPLLAFAWGVAAGAFPLGVPGEWTWPRLPPGIRVSPDRLLLGGVAVAAYAAFCTLGTRAFSRALKPVTAAAWLVSLFLAATTAALALQAAAPIGFGLEKWTFALHGQGSSGYFTVARSETMRDPWAFWADYPNWSRQQDALHIGTHPPGLFLVWRATLELLHNTPQFAESILVAQPPPTRAALRELAQIDPLTRGEQAALVSVGALILLSCAATVWPVYALARASGARPDTGFAAACAWGCVPGTLLFQPTSDTAFPLLSTTSLALVARAHPLSAMLAGAVLALGMQFSLVFLAVGLIAATMITCMFDKTVMKRFRLLLAVGLGFLLATGAFWMLSKANPFEIWWVNQQNHARFYLEFPRSYLLWQLANPCELAVSLGIPLAVWVLVGLATPGAPRVAWATLLVLAILQLSGRSLSEVGRLWLPLMPPFVVAAAHGMSRWRAPDTALAPTLVLQGCQLLFLQCTIQVVYSI